MKQAALQGTRLIKDAEMSAGQTIFLLCKGFRQVQTRCSIIGTTRVCVNTLFLVFVCPYSFHSAQAALNFNLYLCAQKIRKRTQN